MDNNMDNLLADDGVGAVTTMGWSAPEGMAYEEWVRIGNTFQAISDAINWWVGDWLNYGEAEYGEQYVQAINTTGWKLERLQQCKWVAGKLKSCTRVQDLSFTHHRLVAKLPGNEQAFWLRRSVEREWRSGELKAEMQKVLAPPVSDSEEEDDVPFTGSGPRNFDAEGPAAVVEYEQGGPLPVLSFSAMEQVKGLVRSVLAGEWSDATVLARELSWMEER